eukprot:7372733-Pyramimonas_sp.AAC.1
MHGVQSALPMLKSSTPKITPPILEQTSHPSTRNFSATLNWTATAAATVTMMMLLTTVGTKFGGNDGDGDEADCDDSD